MIDNLGNYPEWILSIKVIQANPSIFYALIQVNTWHSVKVYGSRFIALVD